MATNPAFVMCPAGTHPAPGAAAWHVRCDFDGGNTSSGATIYLGDSVAFGAMATPDDSFADGMTLGWGVAAAVLAAWAVTHLRKALIR